MASDFQRITVSQICQMIDLLRPCMDDYLYVYDIVNDFYYISPHAVSRFSMEKNFFYGVVEGHAQFVYPQDLAALQDNLNSILAGEIGFHDLDYRWMDKEGEPVWINCRGYVVRDGDTALYMIGCVNEIGKRQRADNISGLLGQSSLQSFLEDTALPSTHYFLRIGLDDFKEINEKHGVEYGDMILKKTAECISSCITSSKKLYRLIADEFMIVDLSGGGLTDAKELYRQIRQEINRFVEDNHYTAAFTVSGGILECGRREDLSFSTIMKLSEFALNEAKNRGKNRFYIFDWEDYERFLRKKDLAQILQKAVFRDFEGFEAYFQPLFFAETGKLYGAETLMRFHCEKYGMISPTEFIPILEETGLIIPAGRWIMYEALEACKNIQKVIPDFRININISYIQVMKSDIICEVAAAVTEYVIAPSNVVLELTESGMLESDSRFSNLWERLRSKGIQLALDDFGTGYSNFHYLNELRPDIIKIDRTFTAKALNNEYEYKLLSLMSGMVHNLNLKICVEGIETQEEQDRINMLSPDIAQGFFFGRPCPYKEFLDNFVTSD